MDPVAQVHHKTHVMINEQERHPGVAHEAQPVGEPAALRSVQAGRRLVEQEHVRSSGQRPGYRDQLPTALGEVRDRPAADLSQIEQVEQLEQGVEFRAGGPALRLMVAAGSPSGPLGADQDVLRDGEIRVEVDALECPTEPRLDPTVGRQTVQGSPAKGHRALRAAETADCVDQRRLAGPVGPDQADDLSVVHVERDVTGRRYGSMAHGDILESQGTIGGRRGSPGDTCGRHGPDARGRPRGGRVPADRRPGRDTQRPYGRPVATAFAAEPGDGTPPTRSPPR